MIVADGVKTREGDDAQNKFRSGIVTRDAEKKYRHYLRRVKRLTLTQSSVLHGARLLVLDQRHGFAHALRRGICRAVKTPFVLVAQHDRSFVRAADLAAVVDAMCVANEASPLSPLLDSQTEAFRLNYVGFPTSTTATHARHVLSKYALEIAPFEAPTSRVTDASANAKPPVALLPLLQFYDSMHVASTRWYLSRVFGRERYCTLPKGGFIEDTLGQLMLRTAREAARAARVAGDAASTNDEKKKKKSRRRHSRRAPSFRRVRARRVARSRRARRPRVRAHRRARLAPGGRREPQVLVRGVAHLGGGLGRAGAEQRSAGRRR